MRQTMQLWFTKTNRILANINIINCSQSYILQLRHDLSKEYDVQEGEGYFTIMEDGQVVNQLPIPV